MSLLARLLLTALPLFVLACEGNDDQPSRSTPPAPTPVESTTATPDGTTVPTTPAATPVSRPRPEADPLPEELRETALSLLDQVSQLRGTPARREVEMFLLNREQARAFYAGGSGGGSESEEQPSSPTPPPQPSEPPFDLRQETYVLLGLIPPPEPPAPDGSGGGPDLREQEIDNLISQITGFYSNEFGALYLVENSGSCVQMESTIVHELTHALQYQYRDIDMLARERAGDWDGTRALLQVLEGDAVYTETRVLGFSTRSSCVRDPVCFEIPPARSAAPYVVERELDTWYEDGVCFIAAVQEQLTRGITGVFEDPPSTTEQILHPEKYLAGEEAKPVFLNDLTGSLGPGWGLKGQANFGEFGLQNLLMLGLSGDPVRAQAAAAGWGGDGFAFYAGEDGAGLLHVVTRWDAVAEAFEFFDGLVASLQARGGAAPEFNAQEYRTEIGGVTWSVALNIDYVTLLVSTDAEAVAAAAGVVE